MKKHKVKLLECMQEAKSSVALEWFCEIFGEIFVETWYNFDISNLADLSSCVFIRVYCMLFICKKQLTFLHFRGFS